MAGALGRGVRAVLMANHGALVLGADRAEVLAVAEVLEDACRLTVLTRGAARELGASDIDAARTLFETYGA